MENYVTLFDSLYFPQGLSLYKSLVRHSKDFKLWIICLDEKTFITLKKASLPFLNPISLKDLENKRLLNVKHKRSKVEYYWTLTPFVIDFILNKNKSINRVTYLDADIYFFKNPRFL